MVSKHSKGAKMNNEYELITHQNINHMNLFMVQLKYRTPHYHNDMEIGLIVKGKLRLYKAGTNHFYKTGDIYLLNPRETHELFSEGTELIVLSMQLSYKLFTPHYPMMKSLQFDASNLNSRLPIPIRQYIEAMLLAIARSYFTQPYLYEFECIALLNELMSCLLKNIPHGVPTPSQQASLSQRQNRIKKIMDYVEENYQRKLLLQEIADRENLSLTYLSHFIKEMLGVTFQAYLNNVRLVNAAYQIEHTDHNLLDICLDNGFSDIRYLNKLFKKHYNCTPKDYRKTAIKTQSMKAFDTSFESFLSPGTSLELLENYSEMMENT